MAKKVKYIPLWPDIEKPRNKKDMKLNHKQRKERGFGYIDGWSFDTYIAAVISNYAKWYLAMSPGYWHETPEETDKVLKIIENGFANYAEKKFEVDSLDEIEDFKEAMKLFRKYFGHLWT